MMSFMPQVSPVRYSLLQCCLKWPHFQSPQAKRCMSKKHMSGIMFSFFFLAKLNVVSDLSQTYVFRLKKMKGEVLEGVLVSRL